MKHILLLSLIYLSISVTAQSEWTNSYAPRSRHINAVFLNDFLHLLIVGGNRTNDSIQSIFRSDDAGVNYNFVTDDISPWLKSVYFTSSNIGVTVGDYGKVLKTIDGGITWNPITIPGSMSQRHFNKVFFIDAQNGYIVGGHQSNDSISTILKTTDGGNSWSISLDNKGAWLHSVYFSNATTGFAVGEKGTLLKSNDGGINWSPSVISGAAGSRNYKSVFFTSNTTGFIVGGNLSNDSIQTILKTTDGGSNWNVIRDTISPMLNDIYFINSSEGYAVGAAGVVLKTMDTGNAWKNIVLPNNPYIQTFNAVRFLDANYGYIVGNWGIIYRYGPNSVNDISNNSSPDFTFNLNPNPFSKQCNIGFTVDKESLIQIKIFDISGREVALIANKKYDTGEYFVSFENSSLSKGIYICILKVGNNEYSKRMIIN